MSGDALGRTAAIARHVTRAVGIVAAALLAAGAAMLVLAWSEAATAEGLPPAGAARIRDVLAATRIDSVRESVIPGLFEIVAGENVLYADPSARYLVVGHIYDLHTATDLTARRKTEVAARTARIAWETLPRDAAVRHGEGERQLAVFSDPSCGWCRKLHVDVFPSLENVAITEILYPVLPGSMETAIGILCAPDPSSALMAHFRGSGADVSRPTPRGCAERARAALEEARRFGETHGVAGTPLLVAPDGAVHAGFADRERLERWLDRHQRKEDAS